MKNEKPRTTAQKSSVPTHNQLLEKKREYLDCADENNKENILKSFIEANLPLAQQVAMTKNWKDWATKVGGTDARKELESIAYETLCQVAREWLNDREMRIGNFTAYYKAIVDKKFRQFLADEHIGILNEKASSLIKLVKQLGPNYVWNRENITAFAKEHGVSEGVVRAVIDISQRKFLSLDDPFRDDDTGRISNIIARDNPDVGVESAAWYGASPEEILIRKEESGENKKHFDINWARRQLREWLDLLPNEERLTVMYRHLLPSALTKEGEWREPTSAAGVAAQIERATGSKPSEEQVEQWDAGALIRLKAFAAGDFSLADNINLKNKNDWETLKRIREQAGENWEIWLNLLPEEEKSILFYRWFYWEKGRHILPRPFEKICHKGRKETEWGMRITPEEGQKYEENAMRHLKEFAAGSFESADFRKLARIVIKKIPETTIVSFANQYQSEPTKQIIFKYRFRERKISSYTNEKGVEIQTSAPFYALGSKRLRDMISNRAQGREITDEYLEQLEKEVARDFVLFVGKLHITKNES